MTDYEKYPKPMADKTASRSAKQVSSVKGGQQHDISGAMGKHQKTGTGKDNPGSHKGQGKY